MENPLTIEEITKEIADKFQVYYEQHERCVDHCKNLNSTLECAIEQGKLHATVELERELFYILPNYKSYIKSNYTLNE